MTTSRNISCFPFFLSTRSNLFQHLLTEMSSLVPSPRRSQNAGVPLNFSEDPTVTDVTSLILFLAASGCMRKTSRSSRNSLAGTGLPPLRVCMICCTRTFASLQSEKVSPPNVSLPQSPSPSGGAAPERLEAGDRPCCRSCCFCRSCCVCRPSNIKRSRCASASRESFVDKTARTSVVATTPSVGAPSWAVRQRIASPSRSVLKALLNLFSVASEAHESTRTRTMTLATSDMSISWCCCKAQSRLLFSEYNFPR
mmetsp:Transcript_78357/g.227368  ORF Transcript_78357/g.227368 Transcript_78357/m.227368 type:complete len:254 (+) Transcript_78357:440-1201(+)